MGKNYEFNYDARLDTCSGNLPMFDCYFRFQKDPDTGKWCLVERTGYYDNLAQIQRHCFTNYEIDAVYSANICVYDEPRNYNFDYSEAQSFFLGDDMVFVIQQRCIPCGGDDEDFDDNEGIDIVNIFVSKASDFRNLSFKKFKKGKYKHELQSLCGRSEFIEAFNRCEDGLPPIH